MNKFYRLMTALAALIGVAFPARAENPPSSQIRHPDWADHGTIYEVNIRQYSPEGTFRAFESHLPRLQKMGITILWLMPIHPIGELKRKGSLGSYYSVRDYRGINSEFGTANDFRHLIDSAHNSGMKIILDWVGNHCAWDNPLVSEHPSWFTRDSIGAMQPPIADWADVVDLNYESADLQNYMIESLKYWVTEFDIDGYRCDVSGMVPMEFWVRARSELNTLKPVFMLAEDENPTCHAAAFDMTYSWSLHHLLKEIAHGNRPVQSLDTLLKDERSHYPGSAIRMRFIDNHDENSWNKSVFERMGEAVIPFAVLTATLPGMPLVYSGQEAGLDRSLKFFDKDSISWNSLPYESLYTKLLHLKRTHPALRSSELAVNCYRLHSDIDNQLYAYRRMQDNDQVIVMLNLSANPASTSLPIRGARGEWTDLMSGQILHISDEVAVALEPWSFLILSN